MSKLDLRLNPEARKVLDSLAENEPIKGKKTTFAADHVRKALELYFMAKGIDTPVEVDRGGNRKPDKQPA